MFWEAQSRGLNTLLVEERDYCAQTSANSLKTIHGGIRYLQTLNLARTWRSSREPEIFMKIAPHLVHQLACLLPTQVSLKRSRLAVTAGFAFYNLIKKFSCRSQHLPSARCLSKSQLVSMTDLLDTQSVTGAGLWFDAQVQHAERLGQAFVNSAERADGDAYNYLKATTIKKTDNQSFRIGLDDQIDQKTYHALARSIIFCTASSTQKNLRDSLGDALNLEHEFCLALNLVVNNKYSDFAIGLQSGFASESKTGPARLLFSAPWRNSTLFGTWYFRPAAEDAQQRPSAQQISYCLDDVNKSYPRLNLNRGDIIEIHAGLLPVEGNQTEPEYNLMEHDRIVQPDKTQNIFTVIPTKFTTCRVTSEKVIDLLSDNINTPVESSVSAKTPLSGGDTGSEFSEFVKKCHYQYRNRLPKTVIDQLCVSYGDQIDQIIQLCETDENLRELIPGSTNHIKAQLIYELNQGSIFKPDDFIHRRSFLGSDNKLNKQTLTYCCEIINRFHSLSPDIDKQVNEMLNNTLY